MPPGSTPTMELNCFPLTCFLFVCFIFVFVFEKSPFYGLMPFILDIILKSNIPVHWHHLAQPRHLIVFRDLVLATSTPVTTFLTSSIFHSGDRICINNTP